MKKLLPIFVLALAVTVAAQKPPKGFFVEYDKFTDETEVSFLDYDSAFAAAWFTYKGKTLDSDVETFLLTFDGRRCDGYCFNDPELIFLIDGERTLLPKLSRVLSDSATFPISRDLMARLIAAKKIEYRVGRFEAEWKEKLRAKLKTLLDLGTVKK